MAGASVRATSPEMPDFRALLAAFRLAPPPVAAGPAPATSEIGPLRDRDPGAWQSLFAAEMPAIYRYALSRLGRMEEAEDATSQVFEEAWEHAGSLEYQGLPPRAWLFGIARNVVNSHRRRWLRRPPPVALESFDGAAPERGLEPELLDLAQALKRLKRGQAEVISLRFIHGLSLEEVAVALETSVDAIKGRQARALSALRTLLDGPQPAASATAHR